MTSMDVFLIAIITLLVVTSWIVTIVGRPLFNYYFEPSAPPFNASALLFGLSLMLIVVYRQYSKRKAKQAKWMKNGEISKSSTLHGYAKKATDTYSKTIGIDGKYFLHRIIISEVVENTIQWLALQSQMTLLPSKLWAVGASGVLVSIAA